MFLEILLAFGLFLPATTSQVRAGPVGVGEVCLLLWLVATSVKAMLEPSVLITPPFSRMMIFWGLFFVGMTIGVLTSALLADPHDIALVTHDAIAYCLVALISSLGLLGWNITFQSTHLQRVLVWTGGLTMLLVLMTGLTEIKPPGVTPWFYERFRGLSENPNQLAWSSLCLILLSLRLSDQASTVFERLGAILTATLAMVAGLLTKSNSFNVALAIAGSVFIFFKLWFLIWTPSHRLTIRAAFVWAMICVAPPTLVMGFHLSDTGLINVEQIRARQEGAGDTERVRLELWKQALTRAFESYLLGFGPGPHVKPPSAFIDQWKAERARPRGTLVESHPDANTGIPNFEAHNSYLELLYQGGLLVLIATVWLIGDALVASLKARESALTASLLAVLTFAITHNVLRQPFLWFSIASCLATTHAKKQVFSANMAS